MARNLYIRRRLLNAFGFLLIALALLSQSGSRVTAQSPGPVSLHPGLEVRTVLSGLNQPIGAAFLNESEMFVIEKGTGMVHHVVNGAVHSTALDLAVNFASERGLLSIALDPDFANNKLVYLYWTCQAPAPAAPDFPTQVVCAGPPATGADTNEVLATPLLGNRVDRFVWDGSTLAWDRNLVELRSYQADGAPIPRGQGDETQPPRGNHDGGVIRFGPDGKLYIVIGDTGRRGMLQNLANGPVGRDARGPVADDQFGGPFPDDAHLTGVVLRINPDGSAPADNPFYAAGQAIGGEQGENAALIYAYGVRNSFGMDFDPVGMGLWMSENADDAFDELNRVEPGFNSGWAQVMGPRERVGEFKAIETSEPFFGLQQLRYPPTNLPDSPGEARARMVMGPGAHYSDPEFSWKYATAPSAVGFVKSSALGEGLHGDLLVGMSVPVPAGGGLLQFELSQNRERFRLADPRLADRVADNEKKRDFSESLSLLIGTDFGVITDIQTGPNGSVYLVSLSNGAVYELARRDPNGSVRLGALLSGAAEVPGPGDQDGSGESLVLVRPAEGQVCFVLEVQGIALPATGAHIHRGGPAEAGPVVVPLTPPAETGSSHGCASADPALLAEIAGNPGGFYVNVHTAEFPGGAVRGQLQGPLP